MNPERLYAMIFDVVYAVRYGTLDSNNYKNTICLCVHVCVCVCMCMCVSMRKININITLHS